MELRNFGYYLFCLVIAVGLDFVSSGRCPSLRLPNGRARIRSRGRTVQFRCRRGFTRVGPKMAICLRSNQWSQKLPLCVGAGCPNLDLPPTTNTTRLYRGGMLHFTCTAGHYREGPEQIYCDGVKWNKEPPICQKGISTGCDFETDGLCGWSQVIEEDKLDWTLHKGATPTKGTGPSSDHTKGTPEGRYLFIETSAPSKSGHSAQLISPIYNPDDVKDMCMDFYYHMYGSPKANDVGRLEVFLVPRGVRLQDIRFSSKVISLFDMDGNQGDAWHRQEVEIPNDVDVPFQFLFEGMKQKSWLSDIAIDDIRLFACGAPPGITMLPPSPSTTTTLLPSTTAERSTTTELTTTTRRRTTTPEPTTTTRRRTTTPELRTTTRRRTTTPELRTTTRRRTTTPELRTTTRRRTTTPELRTTTRRRTTTTELRTTTRRRTTTPELRTTTRRRTTTPELRTTTRRRTTTPELRTTTRRRTTTPELTTTTRRRTTTPELRTTTRRRTTTPELRTTTRRRTTTPEMRTTTRRRTTTPELRTTTRRRTTTTGWYRSTTPVWVRRSSTTPVWVRRSSTTPVWVRRSSTTPVWVRRSSTTPVWVRRSSSSPSWSTTKRRITSTPGARTTELKKTSTVPMDQPSQKTTTSQKRMTDKGTRSSTIWSTNGFRQSSSEASSYEQTEKGMDNKTPMLTENFDKTQMFTSGGVWYNNKDTSLETTDYKTAEELSTKTTTRAGKDAEVGRVEDDVKSPASGSSEKLLPLILGVVAAVVLVAIVIAVLAYKWSKKRQMKQEKEMEDQMNIISEYVETNLNH